MIDGLPKQTRSSGGQNVSPLSSITARSVFQSRPDLQGVKTKRVWIGYSANRLCLPKQTRSSGGQNPQHPGPPKQLPASKADPIFRGSKPSGSTAICALPPLPKQTRSSGGQNMPSSAMAARSSVASKADPIFRGSKQQYRRTCRSPQLPKQTRSSGGQNAIHRGRFWPCGALPKQTRSSGGQNASSCEISPRRASLPKQTRSSGGQNR